MNRRPRARTWAAAVCAAAVATAAPAAHAQSWVESRPGPAPGDSGPRTDAIRRREMLDVYQSPARLEDGARVAYNHPSMLCRTREGTLIFMWNGGPSEAERANRLFYVRRPAGAAAWSEPVRLETRQIDFGTLHQPTKAGAPVLAAYWLGPPRGSGMLLRFSEDDGRTWSEAKEFPATDDPFWAARPAGGHFRFSMSPPIEFPDGRLWFASEQRHQVPAIVEVPPGNYTADPRGTAWTSLHPDTFAQGVHGDFLVLSPTGDSVLFINRQGGNYLTRDGGKTWTVVEGIPKGGAGVAALSLDVRGGPAQGWHLVAGCAHPGRNGLSVHISRDPTGAGSWRQVLTLHQDLPAEDADPSMIQTPDRQVHLLFTGRGSPELKYYVLDPDRLVADAPPARLPEDWPQPPLKVTATPAADGVELTWQPAGAGPKGFLVWRQRYEEGEVRELVAELPGSATRCTDAGPLKRGRYGYWVQAFSDKEKSRFSAAVSVTGGTGPRAPSGGEGGPGASPRRGEDG